jgi:hypothetical protein
VIGQSARLHSGWKSHCPHITEFTLARSHIPANIAQKNLQRAASEYLVISAGKFDEGNVLFQFCSLARHLDAMHEQQVLSDAGIENAVCTGTKLGMEIAVVD